MLMFRDKVNSNDLCSVVGNPFIPNHTDAVVLEVNRDCGTARVQYTLKGETKTRTVELSDICPPLSELANGLAECLVALIKVS